MSLKNTLTLAFFFLVTPPVAVYSWQTQVKQQELRSTPPQALPGSVVMLYSPGCEGCKTMLPIVEDLMKDGYRLRLVNVDEQPQAAREYNVRGVPTIVYEVDGQEQFRTVSMLSPQTLEDFCRGIYKSNSLW